MFVLSLCRQFCPDKIPVQPDFRLGAGADGECFSIVDDPDKVIKLGILYECHDKELKNCFKHIQKTLDYLINTQPESYVQVYEQGYLGTFSRGMVDWPTKKQEFIIYYYLMEKLLEISEDESKVFHTILSHEDRGIIKNYSLSEIEKILEGLSRGLDFDAEKVTLFCNNIKKVSVVHCDMHDRNIMKNRIGSFKLIDPDRIELEK